MKRTRTDRVGQRLGVAALQAHACFQPARRILSSARAEHLFGHVDGHYLGRSGLPAKFDWKLRRSRAHQELGSGHPNNGEIRSPRPDRSVVHGSVIEGFRATVHDLRFQHTTERHSTSDIVGWFTLPGAPASARMTMPFPAGAG